MKTCRMLNLFLAALIVGLMSSGKAKALYLYDYVVFGPELEGEGFVEFATDSTTPDGVMAFSWQGKVYDNSWSCFGPACLAVASWDIDDILGITRLDLQVGYKKTSSSGVSATLELFAGSAGSWCWDQISERCDGNDHDHTRASVSFTSSQPSKISALNSFASFATAQQVPEPSSILVLSIGLATLGVACWKRW